MQKWILALVLGTTIFSAAKANTEAVFMRQVRNSPRSIPLRLEFADWLEANGQKQRAKFIRLMIEDETHPRSLDRLDKLSELVARHQRKIAPGIPESYFHRDWVKSKINYFKGGGFPLVQATVEEIIEDLPVLLGDEASSVIGLVVQHDHDVDERHFKKLWKCTELSRVAILHLYEPPLKYRRLFLESPTLTNLRVLHFGEPGVFYISSAIDLGKQIATSANFSGLEELHLPIRNLADAGDIADLIETFLKSEVLSKVEASPLIIPGSIGRSIDNVRKPSLHISQRKWDKRLPCAKRLTLG